MPKKENSHHSFSPKNGVNEGGREGGKQGGKRPTLREPPSWKLGFKALPGWLAVVNRKGTRSHTQGGEGGRE